MKIKKTLVDAGKACEVLNGVIATLEFDAKRCDLEGYHSNQSGWGLGYEISSRKPSPQSPLGKVIGNVKPRLGEAAVWFGYCGAKPEEIIRSIWLYCRDQKTMEQLSKRLQKQLVVCRLEPQLDDEGQPRFIEITSEVNSDEPDHGWFVSVFRTIGV